MFDKTTAVSENLQAEEMAAIWGSDAFASCDEEPDKYGRLQVKNYKGLTVTLVPHRGKLTVKGSLPTFANDNNLQLLTYPEMQLAIPALAAAVALPITRLVVVGLELSLDIEPSTSPQSFLETLQHHKHKKFCAVPPRNGPHPLEYVAYHTEFNAKLYNKNQWAKQLGLPVPAGHHKLRYEIVLKQARPINALLNRSVITLADLLSPEFYAAAAAELEQRWNEIVRDKRSDYTGLSRREWELLGTKGSKDHWRGLKAVVSAITIKRQKKEYAKLAAAMAKRVGPDEYDQLFKPALTALLPPLATAQNDTFFHTSSLLGLPSMIVVKEAAPPLVDDAGAGSLRAMPSPPACLAADDDDDEREQTTTAARCCQTCGAPIASHRKPEARYCGKKCRNAASNPRNNAKRGRFYPTPAQYYLFDPVPFSKAAA